MVFFQKFAQKFEMRFLQLSIIFLISIGCYSPERNCSNFRTGTFEFEALSGTEIFTTKIIRNDSMEIDYFRGKIDTSSIRWINDCEYIVKKIRPRNRAEEKAIHIKILTTQGNEFTFEFKEVGSVKTRKAKAKKVDSIQ